MSDRGNIAPHPAIKIAKDAQTQAMKVMAEFGLTAKARTKIEASIRRQRRRVAEKGKNMLDELFGDFITTTIRPKAMLEYMDRKKAESDERHLRIEQQLKNGTMHLEPGDFIKGVASFDEYIPSMLSDGVKGGEFNQEHSHSDLTPLDADFGYVSKINIKKAKENLRKEDVSDYEIIGTTISSGYGSEYIVLKSYADRLKDRSSQGFDVGTFTGSPDYYELGNGDNDDNPGASRYIRTGIPVTDIDYIVSYDWNPKNSYEMAMAGIYIPVVNPKGEIVFTSDLRNEKRLKELLAKTKARLQSAMVSSGHSTAYMRAMSYVSPLAQYTDMTSGVGFYEEIEALETLFEDRKDELFEKLEELMRVVFCKENLLVHYTADGDGFDRLEKELAAFAGLLPESADAMERPLPDLKIRNEGFRTAAKVQ